MKYITRPVWILSLVSLFTDTASEMLYPIMPIYLKSIGFSIVLIGILEGVAEATAGLSKGYFGKLSDKVGLKTIFAIGLVLFSVVYFGMSANTNLYLFFGLFFLYGIYASATEGISKAWISNITDKKDTATAIGTFSGLQSICTMLASSLAGLIWFQFGATTTFLITAIATIFVVLYILTIPKPETIRYGTNQDKRFI